MGWGSTGTPSAGYLKIIEMDSRCAFRRMSRSITKMWFKRCWDAEDFPFGPPPEEYNYQVRV